MTFPLSASSVESVAAESSDPVCTDFTAGGNGTVIRASLWIPTDAAPGGLVLIGHGGYGHRADERTRVLARGFAHRHRLASLAIDGPVHGDRRQDGGRDPDAVKPDWQKLWHTDPRIDVMVEDWRAALTHARELLPDVPIGYFGLSMGSLYGIPLLAAEGATFSAAVLGMWGTNNNTGPRLIADAATLSLPALHYVRWDDEIFDRAGLVNLFDALGSADKQLMAVPGPHRTPDARQTETLTAFLADHLSVAITDESGAPSTEEELR
ncbi:alpha/beta hydrolase [Rhodococcus sp. LB1]|uniref:alpha/beta hydrolase n=1 Tax=Rhodococcus sp. LB1 TaxID=1807499 RepID=UPI00077B03C9|nr:alpha/beta hydrolase [Rhodococcus sp. LB1]KXX59107.1 hypothetical protein AZG88_42650 [Rhodococcus sp. LB1]